MVLKGVIFSLHDVLAKQGPVDVTLMAETFRTRASPGPKRIQDCWRGHAQMVDGRCHRALHKRATSRR